MSGFFMAAAMSGFEAKLSEEDKKAAKERVSKMNDQERAAKLQQAIIGTTENSLEDAADANHLKRLLLTDGDFAKQYKKTVGDADYNKQMTAIMSQVEAEGDDLSIEKAAWDKIRTTHADLYLAAAGEEKAKKFMESDDFNARNIGKDALENEKLIMALASVTTNEKVNGKFQTRIDQLNDKQKEKVAARSKSVLSQFNDEMFTEKQGATTGAGSKDAIDDHMRAFSRIEGAGSVSAELGKKIADQLKEIEGDSERRKKFNEDEIAAIRKRLIDSKVDLKEAFGGNLPYDAQNGYAMSAQQRKSVRALVSRDASVIVKMDDQALVRDTDVAKEVFNALSKESIAKIKEQLEANALDPADAKEALERTRRLIEQIEKREYQKSGRNKQQIEGLGKEMQDATARLKRSTDEKEIQRLQARIKAIETERSETFAKMDKETMDKVKALRAAQEATQRYI